MTVQNVLSICLFACFVGAAAFHSAMMWRRGVRAIVFGQTDKSDFLLVPLVLAIAYTALAGTFGLPIAPALVRPFWSSRVPGWLGLVLCAAAVAGIVATLQSFGDSFRVGIDEFKPDKLVTGGVFALSRNPIYTCFLMLLAGLFLVHRNVVIAVAAVLFTLAIHRQVLREEQFLASHYGGEYEEYRRKVRRYL